MPRDFGLCHSRVMFERQRRDGLAALAAPADAAKTNDGADIGTAFGQRRDLLRDVEIGLLDADGHIGGHESIAMFTIRLSRRSSAGKKQTPGGPGSSLSGF